MKENGHAETKDKVDIVPGSARVTPDLELEAVRIYAFDDVLLGPFVESDCLFHVVLIVAPSKGKSVNGGSIKDMACDFIRRVPNLFDKGGDKRVGQEFFYLVFPDEGQAVTSV